MVPNGGSQARIGFRPAPERVDHLQAACAEAGCRAGCGLKRQQCCAEAGSALVFVSHDARLAARFARWLEARFGLPVAFVDETLTWAEAGAASRQTRAARTRDRMPRP